MTESILSIRQLIVFYQPTFRQILNGSQDDGFR